MKLIVTLFITLVLMVPNTIRAEVYSLAPANTTIQFKIKNMGIMNVNGAFEKLKGTLDLDRTDITKSKVDVAIETNSINTGINRRDNHLRSSDFFEVTRFPTMSFVSTKIENSADNKLIVIGNLTIKGITKQVNLIVDGWNGLKGDVNRVISATTMVNRQDFGVSYGSVIGDDVMISITTELKK